MGSWIKRTDEKKDSNDVDKKEKKEKLKRMINYNENGKKISEKMASDDDLLKNGSDNVKQGEEISEKMASDDDLLKNGIDNVKQGEEINEKMASDDDLLKIGSENVKQGEEINEKMASDDNWVKNGSDIFKKCFDGFFNKESNNTNIEWCFEEVYKENEENTINLLKDWKDYHRSRRNLIHDPSKFDLPVRLILSTLKNKFTLNNQVSTIIGEKITEFGLTHAELQVGPFVFSWGTNKLCKPRCYLNRDALVVIELGKISNSEDHKLLLKNMCDQIAKWNTSFYYQPVASYRIANKFLGGNCHAFVQNLMDTIKIPWKLSITGKLEQYVSELKGNEIRAVFGGIWKTHKEFDEYWYNNLNYSNPPDIELFKAIDRAFAIREGREISCPYYQNYYPEETLKPFLHESTTDEIFDESNFCNSIYL